MMNMLACLLLWGSMFAQPPDTVLAQESPSQAQDEEKPQPKKSTADWARFRGQNDNAGLAPDRKIAGRPLWEFQTKGQVFASPIIDSKGIVYVACGLFNIKGGIAPGSIYALDSRMGTKIWETTLDDGIGCTPTLSEGTLYFGANDGRVYALDSQTGTIKWKTRIKDRYAYSSPVVVGDTLYVLGLGFYALDVKTGEVKWTYKEIVGASSPAFWDERVFVGSEAGKLLCFAAASGKKLWEVKTGDVSFSAASINASGLLVIGSKTGMVTAIDAKSGSVRWSRQVKGWVRTTAVHDPDGTIYVGTLDGELIALNSVNGATLWKWQAPAEIFSAPTLTPSGRLYFGCVNGKMYAFDTKSKEKIGEYATDGAIYSSPLLTSTGLLIFGSNDGRVYALQ